MHETIISLICGPDFCSQFGQASSSLNDRSEASLLGQGGYSQYKSLSNQALRNVGRYLKLALLLDSQVQDV